MENVLWYEILEYLQVGDMLHQRSCNENKEFLAQQLQSFSVGTKREKPAFHLIDLHIMSYGIKFEQSYEDKSI